MTMFQQSYTTPAPIDKPVVPNPLPDGTIFMFSANSDLYDFVENSKIHAEEVYPDPEHYFTSKEQLLEWVAESYHATKSPKHLQSIVFSRYGVKTPLNLDLYQATTSDTHLDFYIYVWAITPAGGAA